MITSPWWTSLMASCFLFIYNRQFNENNVNLLIINIIMYNKSLTSSKCGRTESRSRAEPSTWRSFCPWWAHCCVSKTDFPWSLDDEDYFLCITCMIQLAGPSSMHAERGYKKKILIIGRIDATTAVSASCANQVFCRKASVRGVK